MKIYLIRHTPVVFALGTCYGQTDVELAPGWQHDFAQLRDKLPPAIGASLTDCVFYSSPLQRCLKLARQLSETVIIDERLMEFNFGVWEGLRWDDIPMTEMTAWRNDYMDTAVPGGETYRQLLERSGAFYQELIQRDAPTAVVITHGGVILALLARILGITPPQSFRLKVDYGSVTVLTVEGDWIKIDYINR